MFETKPSPLFIDRADAGRRLASAVAGPSSMQPLVLGLARGGVIVAAEVARTLGCELDALVVRKLGAPQSEEVAIGAVTASGGLYLHTEAIRWLDVPPGYLQDEIARQGRLANEREQLYRHGRPSPEIERRHVVLVDDGMATGATMIAAARAVKTLGAAYVQIAVPVGAHGTCGEMRQEANDVTCLHQPEPFWAVGYFYEDFSEVSDDEVLQALASARQPETSR